MKRTTASAVVAMLVVGVTIGYLGNVLLAAVGRAIVVPPISLPITLVAIAAVVLALAWPVRQAVKGTRKRPINPIVASRTAVLAKSSSLAGAVLTGLTVGVAYFVFTRSVVPGAATTVPTGAAVLGAIALLVAGLVAEALCTLPPEDPGASERSEGAVGA